MTPEERARHHFLSDIGIIISSLVIAYLLIKTNLMYDVVRLTNGFWYLDSIVAGAFFTSMFTAAPASVALATIAQHSPSIFSVAFFGAVGAVCADLLIFRFIKNNLGNDIFYLIGKEKGTKFKHLFKLKLFRWITFFLGGLVIASPLPDELGLAMLGLSKARTSSLALMSFVFNFLGILAIGIFIRSI